MVNNKNLWDYLIQILPDNANFFLPLNIPDELIHKMFEIKLKVKIITDIFSFCGSTEKVLELINEKIEVIYNCCLEEKKEN